MYRKDYPAPEAIDQWLVMFSSCSESRFKQKISPVSCLLRLHAEGIALFQTISQLKLFNDIITESSFSKIGEAYGLSFRMDVECVHKIIAGILVQDKHALPVALCLLLLIRIFLFNDFYSVFSGYIFQSLVIGELLVLHYKVNGRSPFPAGKTFAYVFRR